MPAPEPVTGTARTNGGPGPALRQPFLGLLVLVGVVIVSLGLIATLEWPTFRDSVSYYLVCAVPTLFVVGPFWRGEHPRALTRLAQPWRGLALTGLALVVAAVVAVVVNVVLGEGRTPPSPNVAHIVIMAVPFTFLFAVVWDGWPFRRMGHQVLAGLALQLAAYLVAVAAYLALASYDSFKAGPAYVAALDPGGPFDAWALMTFVVTTMAVALLLLHLDLWPLAGTPALAGGARRAGALTAVILVVSALAMWLGTGVGGLDPPTFLVGVAIPFIFGSIVVLNVFEGALPLPGAQPVRGLASAVLAAVIGLVLAGLYAVLATRVSGDVPFGGPGYQGEVWLASALLAVTFPLLSVVIDCFGFWPARRAVADAVRDR